MARTQRPIHTISLPAHHPAVSDMDEDDMVQVTAKRAPQEMPPMPNGSSPRGERPMPLTHDFHVTDIRRMPRKAGGSSKRPGPGQAKGGEALEYLKERQADEAKGTSNSVS